jgi:hypothetical protein
MLKQTGSVVAVVAGLSLVFVGSLAAQVPNNWLGTWKMNVAKSKCSPDPCAQSNVSHWEAVPGGGLKIVGDAVDAAGKSTHTQVVTMLDGKEAELKGAAVPTTRQYTKVDDRTYEFVTRVNGKVTTTSRGTMSPDGKTRTLVTTGTNADGKPVKNTGIYERQ